MLFVCLAIRCAKDEPSKICAQRCSASSPWRVESLDLGLPCFSSIDDCRNWANLNGYSDKPCVKCN